MSQLPILAERMEHRPREEWFSGTFLIDWEGQHTSKRECNGRHCDGDKEAQSHGTVPQNNDGCCHCPPALYSCHHW